MASRVLLASFMGIILAQVLSADEQVSVGHTAVLPCVLDFVTTSPQVLWIDPKGTTLTFNEETQTSDERFSVLHPYSREYNLQIEETRVTDDGTYKCMIDAGEVQTKTVKLTITRPPTISATSGNQVVAVGDPVTLWCNSTGIPDPLISWTKLEDDGKSNDLSVTGREFHIANASVGDSGNYVCTADNGTPPPAQAQMVLQTQYAPILTLPHSQVSQQLGKDTLLECIVQSSPHETALWQRDGVPLVDGTKYQLSTWDVGDHKVHVAAVVKSLEISDYGEYVCVASNRFGSTNDSMTIYEWNTGHIQLKKRPVDTTVARGTDSVRFNCTVEGFTHRDSLSWYRKRPNEELELIFTTDRGEVEGERYEILGHYDLLVKDVTLDDAALYQCDILGVGNYSAFLTVAGEVYCRDNANSSIISAGETATLTCAVEFRGIIPAWEVTWEFNDLQMSSINVDTDNHLERKVVFPAHPKDSGKYTCDISAGRLFRGQCSRSLEVIEGDTSAPVCQGKEGIDLATFSLVLGIVVFALILLFAVSSCCIVTHYKRQMRIYRNSPVKSDLSQDANGSITMETTRLTSQEEPLAEQEV
ncbi:hypothetical protein CAPTEDRAFT_226925 [Capitella teleta]|uniref:Ig-like domain-containing protein n=1 Tax=Capitella teleta TaxID=283909 RepID=R7U0W8_CAPTE|nr:hypothetical protein CAPTEDRAFT_226925 [Capitella teleta]|eukprot:ELT99838.1 hypothetical protein CAPTEDRAFT_226925 [Capitella teleta]